MAGSVTLKVLQKLLSTVNNAVVFLDDGVAECIHWMNAVDKIFSAGALEIRSIRDTKVAICFICIPSLQKTHLIYQKCCIENMCRNNLLH